MTEEQRGRFNRLGPYKLGRRFKRLGREMGRLYKARDLRTGEPALTLMPADQATWAPAENWRTETISRKDPPSITLKVKEGPASGQLADMHDTFEMLTATLLQTKDDPGIREHLTRPPTPRRVQRPTRPRHLLVPAMALALGSALLGACVGVAGLRSLQATRHGNESLAAVESRSPVFVDGTPLKRVAAITYPLPAKPFSDQAKPPCLSKRGELTINGGCWMTLEQKPPCHEDLAEYQGKCYVPVGVRLREPQVVDP